MHHGGGTVPTIGSGPIVLTIHDLQYLTHPEYLTPVKRRYLRTAIPRSIRRATVVAVPTEYVRVGRRRALRHRSGRVVVVPHGVEPHLGSATPRASPICGATTASVRAGPRLPGDHPSAQGSSVPAGGDGAHWTDPDLRLVLLGGAGAAPPRSIGRSSNSGSNTASSAPAACPAADRDGLIAMADALVFPSEYEGFGAPVVEAMALGTPVICSDQPALAEVVGDAGLVLPRDADAWADALDLVARRRAAWSPRVVHAPPTFTAARSGAALAAAYRLASSARRDARPRTAARRTDGSSCCARTSIRTPRRPGS